VSSPSCARAAASVPRAADGAWRIRRPIWSIACFRRCRSASGCSRCPTPRRYRCAYDARLTSEVLRALIRSLFAEVRRRVRRHWGVRAEQCGAVTFIQRFGSALDLNGTSTRWRWTALTPTRWARVSRPDSFRGPRPMRRPCCPGLPRTRARSAPAAPAPSYAAASTPAVAPVPSGSP
jgi:hypothetical protein